MATIQLNVEGNVGELIPDLTKAAASMDTLHKKTIANASETKKAFQVSGQYVNAYNNALKQGLDITMKTGEATAKLGDQAKAGTAKAEAGVKSFRIQLKEATLAAQQAQQQFSKGLIDEKTLIQAQQRVADLKEEIEDFGKRIDALNPEAKFTALAQVTQGVVGGFQAMTGAIALFGGESEDVQKAILKLQAVMNFSQGINQLLTLGDTFKNLAAVLGITATAQKAVTVATEGTAVAAGVATTAAVAETGATQVLGTTSVTTAGQIGILRTALNLLLGPLGIILLAIGAVIALWAVFHESGESNADMLERLSRETEAYNKQIEITRQRQQAVNEVMDANTEILKAQNKLAEALTKGDINLAAVKEANAKKELEDQRNKLTVQLQHANKNFDDNLEAIARFEKERISLQAKNRGFEVSDDDIVANNKRIAELQEFHAKASAENAKFVTDKVVMNSKLKALDIEGTAEEKLAQQERIQATIEFNKHMKELQEDLANSLRELGNRALPKGTLSEQIEAERKTSIEALTKFRDDIIKKINEINEARDKRQGTKTATVTVDSFNAGNPQAAKDFQDAITVINRQAAEKQIQVEIDKQMKLVELRETGEKKEIDLFILNAKKSEQVLREAGATEIEIEEAKQKGIIAIQNKYALQKLDIQKNESDAAIDQIKLSGVSIEQAEKIKAQKRLEFDLMQAEKRLQILAGGQFTDKELSDAQAQIEKLTNAVNKGKAEIAKGEPLSLAKIFGVDSEHFEEFNQNAEKIAESFKSLLNSLLEAEMQRVDQHLENNQKLIDSDNDRIAELEASIDKDNELNKQGLANDLNLHKKQLADLKAQRDKDLAEQKRIQEEKKKLAQQQAILNSITTGSQLILSTINTIESFSELGPYGFIAGLAAAAALVAGFLSIKANIEAASSDSQSFGEGGEVDGEPHSKGGNKYVRMKGNKSYIKEIEEGEFLTKKRVAQKKKPLLKALNDENEPEYRRLMFEELFPFLKSQRIALSDDVPDEIYHQRQQLSVKERTAGTTMAMAGVEKRLDSFHEDFTRMVDDRLNEEHHHITPDAHYIVKRGGKSLEIIKKHVSS